MSRVSVTIDRLVLNGFEPDQRQALVAGLQQELARILADPAMRSALKPRDRPRIRLTPITFIPGDASGRSLGAKLAHGIGRGLAQ
jgi:hypothetical protein